MSERVGAGHYGAEVRETAEAKAERVVVEELEGLKWSEQDLAGRLKGDSEKVRMAARLRVRQTKK